MRNPGWILLTGATGLLGRYLLRDLLRSGRRVALLVRNGVDASAEARVRGLATFLRDDFDGFPCEPIVLAGDLHAPGLELSRVDRNWLARQRPAVVHAAACVGLREGPDGEPFHTNVDGTGNLLDLCEAIGLAEFHYVSTAFVCGDQVGPVDEEAYDWGHAFHNEYEQSKYEAERLVRQAPGLRSTVYRPSVIVGDSRTGHTSTFHGLYRFLSLADRLAGPRPATGRRRLDLRLPFQGDEGRDLVPVDWVARAIVQLVNRPECHGKTYHLVAQERTPVGVIRDVAEEALGIDGVRLAGRGPLQEPTPLEEMFLGQLQEYWPYLDGDPVFDSRNTRTALPDLPAPRLDRALLTRLIRYAAAAGWGRPARARPRTTATVDCARYLEEFFPDAARRSSLAKAPLDVTVALEVTGGDGGRWLCRWEGSDLAEVRPDRTSAAAVAFRMDSATFAAVVRGRLTTQNAFFDRRVEIAGDVEKGLKLAVLFDHFVKEFPYGRPALQEVGHAVAVRD